jgi:putative PIN family toxin of toxin-antitoxin system
VRVVLDSNVLIAAAATRGLCEAIVELCLEQHKIVLGEGILAEVEEKLTGKLKVPAAIAREYLKLLRSSAEIMKPAQVERGACRDPEDLMVLGLIEAGRAEVLVSGDKDLLVLREFAGARVFSPRGFWEEAGKRREDESED